ncbi:MAG: hypothetical protein NZ891_08735 [bacterium]|nr:hypothetical protein [bacterium]MDW8164808.1 hypothetical protein [Candidatus Omnitrophota bacterium]
MFNFSIEIESIENYQNPANFLNFLSEEETENKNLISLIGKVALKKAFFKCLGIKEDFKKIKIKKLTSGKPIIEIKDKTLKKILRNKKVSVSISHTKDIAVAICLIYE